MTTPNETDLKFLGDLMAEGNVKPFVEKTYSMREAADAQCPGLDRSDLQ